MVVYSVHDVCSCNVRQSVSMIVVVLCKKVGLTSVTTVLLVYSMVVYSMVVYSMVV